MTSQEIKEVLEKAKFPEGLTAGEALKVSWWGFFNRKKLQTFAQYIKDGMHIKFAYQRTIS